MRKGIICGEKDCKEKRFMIGCYHDLELLQLKTLCSMELHILHLYSRGDYLYNQL